MQMCPSSNTSRRTLTRAQQEFVKPVTSPQLILLRCFTRTHQIAQRLGALVGNPDRRQIAGSVTARQLLGIAPVGLHTVASLDRDQGRRDHLALHTWFRQLPIQDIASRPGFITGTQLLHRAKLLQ